MKFEQLPPQAPADTVLPCKVKAGGVVVYYPRYFRYLRDDLTLPWWFPALRAWWAVQRAARRLLRRSR